jgi:hypothetical protein
MSSMSLTLNNIIKIHEEMFAFKDNIDRLTQIVLEVAENLKILLFTWKNDSCSSINQ